jgi:rhodanese-related sulfurtransferase
MPTSLSSIKISASALLSLIGSAHAPQIVDVRIDEDYALDPRLIPSSIRASHKNMAMLEAQISVARPVVISCQKGMKLSEGVAALLRLKGFSARVLDGGHEGWAGAKLPLFKADTLPLSSANTPQYWVTRERPKIDRIACPWLIRRFIDPRAQFLYVTAAEVHGVASRFDAIPYDVPECFFTHRGEETSFDTILFEAGLQDFTPLKQLATIVRGADTDRLELSPQAAGLLAISLGLSALESDDLTQLAHGMLIYDALYAWCCKASGETHNWREK